MDVLGKTCCKREKMTGLLLLEYCSDGKANCTAQVCVLEIQLYVNLDKLFFA